MSMPKIPRRPSLLTAGVLPGIRNSGQVVAVPARQPILLEQIFAISAATGIPLLILALMLTMVAAQLPIGFHLV
ncbi:hypothetical protein IVB12_24330 [Bradyrhizobium sp. 179]|uniref:hypothetical protein n=1 Tax=Bradyrhizobium sp. 179 TaxID=2782648 RepID=UPI001FF78189|nr:hypothetical protein [Bradyrhizobium sp. 179]MCK1544979.1 hypothetical protein [Bradyrhizobium sp. 179]